MGRQYDKEEYYNELKDEVQYRLGENMSYRRYGQQHRIVGPTSLWYDGDMFWLRYNLMHREDGLAE